MIGGYGGDKRGPLNRVRWSAGTSLVALGSERARSTQ